CVPGTHPPTSAVHPHVRGACQLQTELTTIARGPSPRAWGLQLDAVELIVGLRSIPTCVGPAQPCRPRRVRGPVHPHVRGACLVLVLVVGDPIGPSPRARGLHTRTPTGGHRLRSIPTCVGPAGQWAGTRITDTVHPHVRGACWRSAQPSGVLCGPSPRAWGLRTRSTPRTRRARSIPTCVGPAYMWFNSGSSLTVHPHVRGACEPVPGDGAVVDGPSPRAWGLRFWTRPG